MIHKTAIIEPTAFICENTKIWAWVHIMPGVRIGENCNIGERVFIGRNVQIGNNCKIQAGAFIPEGVTLENEVFIGPNVTFTNVKRPHATICGFFQSTYVCDNAVIGANATIICGNIIGENAFVAAGAVVTKDVPSDSLVMGNPAKEYR